MLTLSEIKDNAKYDAQNWEIEWNVIDNDVVQHQNFKDMLEWANTFDLEAAESVYTKLFDTALGNAHIDDIEFPLTKDNVDPYIQEAEKLIREVYILRDLGERYNLIMSITNNG